MSERSSSLRRKVIPLHLFVLAALWASLATLLWHDKLLAQVPYNFRIPPLDLPDIESGEADTQTLPESTAPLRQIIVDTDMGVDDAAALIWLMSQQRYEINVEGIVTVAGNTNVDQATNNAQLILDWLGIDVPLVRGSESPLVQPLSLVPSLIHGPDGLWFTFAPPATPDSTDPVQFYCDTLRAGMLVIPMGPVTNVAKSMEVCPSAWNGVEVSNLGGSRATPNQTPVTEYNYWQDPEAAAKVLTVGPANGATIHVVLSDAFSQLTIRQSDVRFLRRHGVPAIKNLLPALGLYMLTFTANGDTPSLPDVVAAIHALERRLATSQSALVEVLAGDGIPEVARGQTIIGLSFNERVTMVVPDAVLSDFATQVYTNPDFDLFAELDALLAERPDNAFVVTDIDARRMRQLFLLGVSSPTAIVPTGDSVEVGEQNSDGYQIFVPLILD